MTPTKILIGQILITFLVVIGTVWAATEWAAFMLGFQARLGTPWFTVFGWPVYYPWRLFEWWYAFEVYAPTVFYKAGGLAAAGGIMGTLVAVVGSLWRAREQSQVTTYGSARWAEKADLKQAGLLNPKGVFLGRYGSDYLRHDGPEHIMTFAPTRSGKGVGLVIPTLLSWTGSVVVHDLKGENWHLTSGWRSTFSHCLCFNPTDISSVHYNPLMEVRRGLNEVRDTQNIADILVDPEGSLERHNHWEKTSHSLLVGMILHVLYAEEEKTLSRVAEVLSDPAKSFKNTLKDMLITNHVGDYQNPKPHPVVAATARELLNKSENERSGVLSTALSFLSLYRDPVVKEVTSKSDFTVMDLMKAEKPVSLYLVVPPSDLSRTKPLMRLILNQIGRRLTEKLEAKAGESRQLLLMLDEFPALGRLDFFETSLAFMAGYGIRAFLIAQSLNQISKAYGENNSILDNCHVRVAFATNDERTAKRISDSLGAATELRSQKNYAGHRLSPWLGHVMVSRQETARQLLTPGEVMQLPMTQELVQIAGLPPIKAQKLRYYEDLNFTTRVLPPAATLITEAISERASDWQNCQAGIDARLVTVDDQNNDMASLTSEGALEHVPTLMPEPETPEPSIDIFEVIDPDVDESSVEADKYQLSTFQRATAFEDETDLGLDLGPEKGEGS